MRGIALVGLASVALALTTAYARSEPQPLLIDCWDGTFSYTMVGLRPADTGYELRVTSQEETLFAPLYPQTELEWGRADVNVVFAEDACVFAAARALFSCHAGEAAVTLTVHYNPRDEASYSVTTVFHDFKIAMIEVIRAEALGEPTPLYAYMLTIEGKPEGAASPLDRIRTYVPFSGYEACGSSSRLDAFTLYDW